MTKSLIFAAYFYPRLGGHEQITYELASRLVPYNYDIDLITCNTECAQEYENYNGIHIYRLPSWDILGRTFPIPKPTLKTLKLFHRILNNDYDFVQTNTRFFATSLIGLLVSKLIKKPLLHIEFGSRHSVLPNRMINLLSKLYDHSVGAIIIKNADGLICNCMASERFLRHLGAKRRISCIPIYGINKTIFRKRDTNISSDLGIKGNFIITSISRLIYAKGVQDIILAFPQVRQKYPDSKLIIIGDGPYKPELMKLANEVDKDSIMFLGQLQPLKIAEILNITDIIVNASYSEALIATPVIEAGAIGVPNVTTDVGGAREIIEDYNNGLFFSPGDKDALARKICEILYDKGLREKLGVNIKLLVENNFDWDKNIELYLNEIKILVKGGRIDPKI